MRPHLPVQLKPPPSLSRPCRFPQDLLCVCSTPVPPALPTLTETRFASLTGGPRFPEV